MSMAASSALATAFWLGILTSISPCPLATNLAALSYISGQGEQNHRRVRTVLAAGLLYSAGRMLAYVLLSLLLVSSILASPSVSFFLQKYMHLFLGPLLIVVGMILLELITIPLPSFSSSGKLKQRLGKAGIAGAFPLGFLFALTFCPVSAALYFGSLIPLAIQKQSAIGLPTVYGFATAVPVIAVSLTLIFGANAASIAFTRVTAADKWIRLLSGAAIVLIGVYLCCRDIFGLL